MREIAAAARGRWGEILSHFGVMVPSYGKHGPCPVCGGRDRFRYDNKDDRGTFYCSGCGAGDGFILLSKVKGEAVTAVAERVRVYLQLPASKAVAASNPTGAMQALWDRSHTPREGGPVHQYIVNRCGVWAPLKSIRECSSAYDPDTRRSYPAMIAKVAGADNKAVNLHITYLTPDGRKAPIDKPKRVMAGRLPEGCAIRLFNVEPVLGVAEGIETAIGAHLIYGMPVWATISTTGMTRWIPPATVQKVVIFADNDANYAGHAAAYALAHRLITVHGKEVEFNFPLRAGEDFADMAPRYLTLRQLTLSAEKDMMEIIRPPETSSTGAE